MPRTASHRQKPTFLGIEGGGTRTVAVLADAHCRMLRRIQAGPANVRLTNDFDLRDIFQSIAKVIPHPDAIAIGLAGALSKADRQRIHKAARLVWPGIPCHATNDLATALAAATPIQTGASATRVLVLSGTGSCCLGRNPAGRTAKVGGWGHVLGDAGSGYRIGLDALRAMASYVDRHNDWPKFGRRLLKRLRLNTTDDLIRWAQAATKSEIAGLATGVFAAARVGDMLARAIINSAAEALSGQAMACARQLGSNKASIQFMLSGGNLLKQSAFRDAVKAQLRRQFPRAQVTVSRREGAWGAISLAQEVWRKSGRPLPLTTGTTRAVTPAHSSLPATERRNPRSLRLDKLSVPDAIGLVLAEDARIPAAVLRERGKIATAIRWITSSFRTGGRLFYFGAGTSGRLGVLDASECPPTFRTPPAMVQGIIAGGAPALQRAVEGAEDNAPDGARSIKSRKITRRDVVVGIAASGSTPFVWGALKEAKRRRARTILITFNPALKIPRHNLPSLVIAPDVGPEILTGSTRLKAGTATKLVLNLFTTLAMVRLGKVMSNLMVDLHPTNAKLRDRAVRIVQELTGADYPAAQQALVKTGWRVRGACQQLRR